MKRFICSTATIAIAASITSPAFGQTTTGRPASTETGAPATDSGQLEDVVVTARKTTEDNQKAPASIVAVAGSDLAARGISDPQALEKFLPSASLRRQGPVTQVFIRGIGTRSDLPNFAAASAFVYNGLIVQRYGTFGLTFDLDRVESIAGPQGTLYGGSAAGGAINLFSAVPRNDNSGYANLEVATYEAIHASLAQNVPISDAISFRAAFDYNRRDAYYTAGINSQNNYSGRAALLIKPSSDFSAHIFYSHGHDDGKPIATLITNPLAFPDDPYRVPATGTNGNPIRGDQTRQDNRNDVMGANVQFSLGNNDFTYIPGYVDFTADYEYYSGIAGNLLQVYDRERQHSQELRWNRRAGPLQLSAGLFYLRDLTEFNDSQVRFSAPTTSTRTVLNVTDQVNLSYAGYAQAVLTVADRVRLTAGGRASRDEITATGKGSGGVPIAFDFGHTHLDYKVGVDFDAADRVLLYANLQSGYIPFGYNPDVTPTPVIPESKLTAISGGLKSRFLDNHLEVNIEGFHYNYGNFQAVQFVTATGLSTVLNAAKSTILGADISVRAQVTPTTRLNFSLVIERAKYDEFQGVGYNFSGNTMINAPKANINAGIQQTIHLGNGGRIDAQADSHYESGHYSTFINLPNTKQARYIKSDLSLTYVPPGARWNLQAFVRNLENSVVYTTLSATTVGVAATGGLEAPRTFGVRFSANW